MHLLDPIINHAALSIKYHSFISLRPERNNTICIYHTEHRCQALSRHYSRAAAAGFNGQHKPNGQRSAFHSRNKAISVTDTTTQLSLIKFSHSGPSLCWLLLFFIGIEICIFVVFVVVLFWSVRWYLATRMLALFAAWYHRYSELSNVWSYKVCDWPAQQRKFFTDYHRDDCPV